MGDEEINKLYTLYRDGVPYEYRYGPEWVAKELELEGGYKTKQEAIRAWSEYEQDRIDKEKEEE